MLSPCSHSHSIRHLPWCRDDTSRWVILDVELLATVEERIRLEIIIKRNADAPEIIAPIVLDLHIVSILETPIMLDPQQG